MKRTTTSFICLLALGLSFPVFADPADKLTRCDTALSACSLYVKDLSEEIEAQNNEIIGLKKQRDEAINEAAKSAPSLLPGWAWVLGGAVLGGVVVRELSH